MIHSSIALIPAYEPNERLILLVRQLKKTGFDIVVVDDGSGAAYRHIFDCVQADAVVLSYPKNQGKGYALKHGFRFLREKQTPSDTVIITMDSDGQHTPEDAARTAEQAAEHPDALTLGVRCFGKGTPLRSQFGNAVTRWVYRISTGCGVSDTQTGLRAFSAKLLPWLLEIEGSRYEYEMNMLLACPKASVPIWEISIETIYLDNNSGSHFHPLRDSFRIYRKLLRFAASSLTSFVIDYGLYSLLAVVLAPIGGGISIPLSNVAARIVSASVNFAINKHFVFENQDSVYRTGGQYFVLAVCILAGNTILLSALVNGLGVNRYAAKLLTEVTFFTCSFLAQRFLIFRTQPTQHNSRAERMEP